MMQDNNDLGRSLRDGLSPFGPSPQAVSSVPASIPSALLPHDPIEVMASNSFCDFHAKGLDYLCLLRTEALTVKAYFYDLERANYVPEVVCPHDHRYPFSTTILAGRSRHYRYVECPDWMGLPKRYQAFKWRTPLLGGEGFTWSHEAALDRMSSEEYSPGETYWCRADEIHTISISVDRTVLLLFQHADVVPVADATTTYALDASSEPPSLSGLYRSMPEDRVRELLAVVLATAESRDAQPLPGASQ